MASAHFPPSLFRGVLVAHRDARKVVCLRLTYYPLCFCCLTALAQKRYKDKSPVTVPSCRFCIYCPFLPPPVSFLLSSGNSAIYECLSFPTGPSAPQTHPTSTSLASAVSILPAASTCPVDYLVLHIYAVPPELERFRCYTYRRNSPKTMQ